jgi:hypothetical protein
MGEEVEIRTTSKYLRHIHIRIATSSLMLLTYYVIPSIARDLLPSNHSFSLLFSARNFHQSYNCQGLPEIYKNSFQKTYLTEMAPSDHKPVYPMRLRAGFQSMPKLIGSSSKVYSIPIIPSIPATVYDAPDLPHVTSFPL